MINIQRFCQTVGVVGPRGEIVLMCVVPVGSVDIWNQSPMLVASTTHPLSSDPALEQTVVSNRWSPLQNHWEWMDTFITSARDSETDVSEVGWLLCNALILADARWR